MHNKVTSFGISKRLSELGYSGPHTGWWEKNPGNDDDWSYKQNIHDIKRRTWGGTDWIVSDERIIKAYDCHDLLVALQELENFESRSIKIHKSDFQVFEPAANETIWFGIARDDQPQNALGLAVIKILEERK